MEQIWVAPLELSEPVTCHPLAGTADLDAPLLQHEDGYIELVESSQWVQPCEEIRHHVGARKISAMVYQGQEHLRWSCQFHGLQQYNIFTAYSLPHRKRLSYGKSSRLLMQ